MTARAEGRVCSCRKPHLISSTFCKRTKNNYLPQWRVNQRMLYKANLKFCSALKIFQRWMANYVTTDSNFLGSRKLQGGLPLLYQRLKKLQSNRKLVTLKCGIERVYLNDATGARKRIKHSLRKSSRQLKNFIELIARNYKPHLRVANYFWNMAR